MRRWLVHCTCFHIKCQKTCTHTALLGKLESQSFLTIVTSKNGGQSAFTAVSKFPNPVKRDRINQFETVQKQEHKTNQHFALFQLFKSGGRQRLSQIWKHHLLEEFASEIRAKTRPVLLYTRDETSRLCSGFRCEWSGLVPGKKVNIL